MPIRAAASPALSLAVLALTSALWSGNAVVGRAIRSDVSPLVLASLQWLLAVLLLLPFVWRELRASAPMIRRHWRQFAVLGVMSTATFAAVVLQAVQYTTATNMALLNSSVPIWVMAVLWLRNGERPALRGLVGFAVSITGVAAIILKGSLDNLLALSINGGDMLALLAMFVWAIFSVLLRERPTGLSSFAYLVVSGSFGLAAVLPMLGMQLAAGAAHVDWTTGVLLGLGYLVLFRTIIATATFNFGIDGVGPARAAPFVHLVPVFGATGAWLFLDERFYAYHFAGFALVVAGIVIANRRLA